MLEVQFCARGAGNTIFTSDASLSVREIRERVEKLTGLSEEQFYVLHNGRPASHNTTYADGRATIVPRLLGGKGGFGSMLRAIGAQIEKTTNREACRDLSGRRLRDINEEKRLKAWIEKQSKREEEAAERKKRKLERLCAEPRHEFRDKNYERERSALTEKVYDAVEAGFRASDAGEAAGSRSSGTRGAPRKTLLDEDLDSDDLDSSDSEEEAEHPPQKKTKTASVSDDSGRSSDESERAKRTAEVSEDSGETRDDCGGSSEELERAERTAEVSEDSGETRDNCEGSSEEPERAERTAEVSEDSGETRDESGRSSEESKGAERTEEVSEESGETRDDGAREEAVAVNG